VAAVGVSSHGLWRSVSVQCDWLEKDTRTFTFIIYLSSKSDDKLVHGHMCIILSLDHDQVGCRYQQIIARTDTHSDN
jgi:hypothetical protein